MAHIAYFSIKTYVVVLSRFDTEEHQQHQCVWRTDKITFRLSSIMHFILFSVCKTNILGRIIKWIISSGGWKY